VVTPDEEVSIRLSGVAYVILKRAHLKSQFLLLLTHRGCGRPVKPCELGSMPREAAIFVYKPGVKLLT